MFRTSPAEVAVNTDHAFIDLVVGNYKKEAIIAFLARLYCLLLHF